MWCIAHQVDEREPLLGGLLVPLCDKRKCATDEQQCTKESIHCDNNSAFIIQDLEFYGARRHAYGTCKGGEYGDDDFENGFPVCVFHV